MGRNYIEVGRLTEDTLPALGCRFVALNDSVDSLMGDNDMAVYRNLFNEFFSRDTSRKVRAVKQAYMRDGKFVGSYAPMGYKKDAQNKHRLVPDEETAAIVRRLFAMRAAGRGYNDIVNTLNAEGIPSPRSTYYKKQGQDQHYYWSIPALSSLMKNEVYIGHMVQGQQGTVSYKCRRMLNKPEEQWVRVENTHEPLVDMATWDTVRAMERKGYKPRKAADGEPNLFAGLLRCADCDSHMRRHITRGNHKSGKPYRYASYACGRYRQSGKHTCTMHNINEPVIIQLTLETIRTHARLVACDEKRITELVLRTKNRDSLGALTSCRRELKALENRLEQLMGITQTLYEDHVKGIVQDGMFRTLLARYERERSDKADRIKLLRSKVEQLEQTRCDAGAWVREIRRCTELAELTPEILQALIDRIVVYEAEVIDGKRRCRVDIVYRFVGNLDGTLAGGERHAV